MATTKRTAGRGPGCGGGGHGRGHRHRGGEGGGEGACLSTLAVRGERPLSAEARAAVLVALDDEHRAEAYYAAVLERFPGALPFARIVEAERRHAAALAAILTAHGVPVPANAHLGSEEMRAMVPATISCAAEVAVGAEIDNVALYEDELLPKVADHPEIAAVFTVLMEASRDRHLPAFRRWGTRRDEPRASA
jgi:rubrerythrin